MTIEYTEKTFKTAVVNGHGLSTTIEGFGDSIKLVGWTLPNTDVPEVCEAMMTLAGHEWARVERMGNRWTSDAANAAVAIVAKRIIARLEKDKSEFAGLQSRNAYENAINIVREECGM